VIGSWAKNHKEVRFYAMESLRSLIQKPIRIVSEKTMRTSDLIIAIGGDGTVLSSARLVLGASVPILGVNAGKVGFLAETRVEELPEILDALQAGRFTTRERIMMDAKIYGENGKLLFRETVLNEVHVRADGPERMVNLNVDYNGAHLTEYWADSLLISTPTGSTAYNLAAGGPIVHPTAPVFVLTPLAPSSLSVRPLVIPSNAECSITSAVDVSLRLVFDGRISYTMQPGEHIELSKSKSVTTFIRMQHGFMDALREKLGWTGKPKLI
jgi:NAD+ kinase